MEVPLWGKCLIACVGSAAALCCGCGGGSSSSSSSNAKGIAQVNHIVILVQENRSFDHYFGRLSSYWAANGFPAQTFDGLPTTASNPGCDPAMPPPSVCVGSSSSPK